MDKTRIGKKRTPARARGLRIGIAAGLFAGLMGCQATAPAPVAESVGTLAPVAYGHSISAPIHHDDPPAFAGVVGSDDDSVTSTITTVIRASDAELPDIAPKTDGVTAGEVRR